MSAIDKNYKYFQDNLETFLADPLYESKFLVIHEEEVKKAFDTFPAAFEYASVHLPEGKFIIQEAIDESKRINILKSAV